MDWTFNLEITRNVYNASREGKPLRKSLLGKGGCHEKIILKRILQKPVMKILTGWT
jgi:hypothetical protein